MQTPIAPPPATARLTESRVTALFLRVPKVEHWLGRYPLKGRVTAATYDPKTGSWTVGVWSGKAGEIATGKVDDQDATVTEAWTGPQVAWKMARGVPGAFGGKRINSLPVWLGFCAVFLLGLIDWRRVLSLRTLDLLVLLSFSVSLWYFNRGDIFTSVPLVYPPLLYLIGRAVWIGLRGHATTTRATLPVWLLLGMAVFLAGFRIGLNAEASNVIDVGYAGVIGAARIVHGQAPYGHMPAEGTLKACGPADADGEIRDRIQANGRCETANERGDTYGPVSYLAYVPGYLIRGWSGKWDDLPAAHITSGLFDLLCLAGMFLVGVRYGGRELGAVLALAWAAYPFTQYASNSNTNDLIPPAFLIWGLWAAGRPWARGALVALVVVDEVLLAGRRAALAHLPGAEGRGRRWAYAGGFAIATAAAFSILLLEPNPLHAARVFWDRTTRLADRARSRRSRSGTGGSTTPGCPTCTCCSSCSAARWSSAAIAFALCPRRKSPLQLAALTAVLLGGFELVLTHWFYLYLPWVFPFLAFAFLAPASAEHEPARSRLSRASRCSSRRWRSCSSRPRGARSTWASTRGARSSTPRSTSATATRSRADRCRTATSGSSTRPARCRCSRSRRSAITR